MKTGLVWLIGKPGSGKTTTGEYLAKVNDNTEYYSFSSLLKEFQKDMGEEGFHPETYEKVYHFLGKKSEQLLVFVSGNPYTAKRFSDLKRIGNMLTVIHFSAPDQVVLERLKARNREVFLHDGSSQEERLEKFNATIQPLIDEILKETGSTLLVEGKTTEELAKEVAAILETTVLC